MQITQNTVVTLNYHVTDADGNLVDEGAQPLTYLHGGYDGIFPLIEEALEGKCCGDQAEIRLAPEDAFGEYDGELVRIEPRASFPAEIEVGMQFEGGTEEGGDEGLYTVVEVTDDKVVVDGNHPLAGVALVFGCTVAGVRPASAEEVAHLHVHGG